MLHTKLPVAAGLGLRLPHIDEVIRDKPPIAWLEVHSENYFGGGANIAVLEHLRQDYPIALHGVGLGVGSYDPLDERHLKQLKQLITRIEPAAVSEHLCWNHIHGQWFNDLLPLPYTEVALEHVSSRVNQLQDYLGCQVLIENLSSYLDFAHDSLSEGEFLAQLVQHSGCKLLLDVNNLYVNQHNLGRDPYATMAALPTDAVGEIHIAGFQVREDGLWIDTHSEAVSEKVWDLLAAAYARFGVTATLLERDENIPPLTLLLAEVQRAQQLIECYQAEQLHVHNDPIC